MYSSSDLDLVGSSMDVWERAPKEENPSTPQRGHFKCTDCLSKPMGARPRYTTASVVDFDRSPDSVFNFVFSRDDLFYRNLPRDDSMAWRLSRAQHLSWAYGDTDDMEEYEFHVRGWWGHDGEFIHNTGLLKLSDHVDIDPMEEDEDDEGGIVGQEFAIHCFLPRHAGTYIHYSNADMYGNWTSEELWEKTWSHPSMDILTRMRAPTWNRRKVKKKKGTGRHITQLDQEVDLAVNAMINEAINDEMAAPVGERPARYMRTVTGRAALTDRQRVAQIARQVERNEIMRRQNEENRRLIARTNARAVAFEAAQETMAQPEWDEAGMEE